MLSIFSLRNGICSKQLSSDSTEIQTEKAGVLGLRLERFALFMNIKMNCQGTWVA